MNLCTPNGYAYFSKQEKIIWFFLTNVHRLVEYPMSIQSSLSSLGYQSRMWVCVGLDDPRLIYWGHHEGSSERMFFSLRYLSTAWTQTLTSHHYEKDSTTSWIERSVTRRKLWEYRISLKQNFTEKSAEWRFLEITLFDNLRKLKDKK